MVFGVSATTMVVVLGAGALALGPRDVPLIARFLGRATGRAVAHVSAFTRAIERSTSGNELRGYAPTFAPRSRTYEGWRGRSNEN